MFRGPLIRIGQDPLIQRRITNALKGPQFFLSTHNVTKLECVRATISISGPLHDDLAHGVRKFRSSFEANSALARGRSLARMFNPRVGNFESNGLLIIARRV